MPTKRCCCGGCYRFEDHFARPDSDDIGNDWEECSGEWSIEAGRLATNSEGYVVLKHMVGNPVGILTTQILMADIIANPGARYQWYVFKGTELEPCAATVTHWLFEMEVLDPFNYEGILRIYEFGGLIVERQILFDPAIPLFEFEICVSNDVITADTVPSEHMPGPPAWFCPNDPADFYFALGSGSSIPVAWDFVRYEDEYSHDKRCPPCDRSCCCPCIEAENNRPALKVEIYAYDCPHMHGVSTTITCAAPPNECCIWTGPPLSFVCPDDDVFCRPSGLPTTYELTPTLQCAVVTDDNPCSGYRLNLIWTPGAGNYEHCLYEYNGEDLIDQQKFVNADCSCDPVMLQFDGFTLRRNPADLQNCCVCCTSFSIIITEIP